ncbi:hypothetical protein B0H65DRAFT_573246 [Neurospora tetraspora]|uniref:Uncharacterized protein n=1 Tax=Neurospora tetraspora TaxID=94610 RepID=A0AAE0MRA9_9PEZI|nr:hypothetical protein B0H65DRAFT_573246 [Neurospora tetraspora]
MTKHIPLTFDKPERWLRMVDYWNDENNRGMMNRIEKLSITFNNWEFVNYCKETAERDNKAKQQQQDLHILRTRSGSAYKRQHQNRNQHGQQQEQATEQRLRAAIRHLTDNLSINYTMRLKQININLSCLWPEFGYRKGPNFKLWKGACALLQGLEQVFRCGFDGNLTTLHITAPENDLVSLLCTAFEAVPRPDQKRLCANLEEFSGRYTHDMDKLRQLPWKVNLKVDDAKVVGADGVVTRIPGEREVEVKSGQEAIEMFVARCPKLKRLEVWRPRELHLRLHPLAAKRGLEVLSVTETYMIMGPISLEMLLEKLATEKTEIQLRDVTAIVRPPGGLVRRPLRPDVKTGVLLYKKRPGAAA